MECNPNSDYVAKVIKGYYDFDFPINDLILLVMNQLMNKKNNNQKKENKRKKRLK